ncbi:putative C-mannosyltransferase DPY19L1 [Araneus ventricosus]|uniref:Putative C-mannosyltransferase DPY19L1 n=1 Tax=Araneus ventricosus TaxID=182803 RepID=A0A4Y2G299_ARAVE|nr:putative C-mannosyltransferase DPY19L1 [Araneus ventricosus]
MAKKTNKRTVKAGNLHSNVKKEKIISKNKVKKFELDSYGQKDNFSFSRRLSKIDGIRPFSIAALAVLFGFFNSYHQATMFENDRHFSHLSSLEREMTFRTEMGLYYFYYKTLTESHSFLDGLNHIMNDNLTEYPSIINTLERFTLYPEVLLAAGYRNIQAAAEFLNVSLKECWQVLRGDDLPPIESCEGIGDPTYFYVTTVFLLNGLVGSLIFLFGTILSDSLSGGILAAACFFFNHGECTRVQWTPPLRESFGYPLFLLQMMLVSLLLKCQKSSFSHSLIIAIPSFLFMLSWQFAQFALLTQLVVLFGVYILNFTSSSTFKHILQGHMISLLLAVVFLFGNKMLIASFYTSTLLICYLIVSSEDIYKKFNSPIIIMVMKGISLMFGCILIKLLLTTILHVEDDAHIWNILKSKFTSYKDFHTMLYTCAAEFDFLPSEAYVELTKTFLLPIGVSTVAVLLYLILCKRLNSFELHGYSDVLYNIFQCIAFFIMAALVMRLKLFFTPHLCLLVSLTMSGKFFRFLDAREMRFYILFGLLGTMSVQGIANIKHQRNIIGEFSNPDLEELISWINATLPEDAVFAGPMPTMANILLSTRRPIVNHPHYENAQLRERTHKVYQIFSRKPIIEVYNTLQTMKVDYVILERSWCFGKRREGCAMVDLWDNEDLVNRDKENFCQKIGRNPYPFRKIFRNSLYTVLSL